MLATLAVVAGTVLVGGALVDMFATLLHPSRRGPLSWHVSLRLFWLTHALAARRRSSAVLSFAGPLAMAAHFIVWGVAAWLGFALLYWPWVDPDGRVLRQLTEAMYVSGESLTTVGFGDSAGPTHALQLITTLEAAVGLATITASISFLLSVYPLVSRVRQVAARLHDAGAIEAKGAQAFVRAAGRHELSQLHRDVINIQQDFKRFPVLALFRPTQQRESLTTLLDGACWVCLQACWGPVDAHSAQAVRFHGAALQRSIEALMAELSLHLVGAGTLDGPATDANDFAARADVFLRSLAAAHLEPHTPLSRTG